MSGFSVTCAHCAQTVKASPESVGSVITCPECDKEFHVKAVRPQVLRLGESSALSGGAPAPAPAPTQAKQPTGKNTKVFKVVKRAAPEEGGAALAPAGIAVEGPRRAEGGARAGKVLDYVCKAGLIAFALYYLVRADFTDYGRVATVEQQQVCGIQQLVLLAKSFLFFFLAYVVRVEAVLNRTRAG